MIEEDGKNNVAVEEGVAFSDDELPDDIDMDDPYFKSELETGKASKPGEQGFY